VSFAIRIYRLPWDIVSKRMPALAITLVSGKTEKVDLDADADGQEELDRFLRQEGPYKQGWVPVSHGTAYVRYEQVTSVRLVG
jgi:hypothetical protein